MRSPWWRDLVLYAVYVRGFYDSAEWKGRTPLDLIGGARFPSIEAPTYPLTLGPHSLPWLRLEDG
jgi:hypothetical protein